MKSLFYIIFLFWLSQDKMPASVVLESSMSCAKDHCTLERKQGMFYQGNNVWPGLVCTTHKALYSDPGSPAFVVEKE